MNESLHMYLTSTNIRVRRERSLWRRGVTPVAEGRWNGTNLDAASIELPPLTRLWMRRGLHVYLGSALCQIMVTTLPQGLRDSDEKHAAAGAQIAHQLGLHAAEWQFAVDGNPQPQGGIVCAVRRALIEQLHSFANAKGFSLVSVKPFASVAWNAFQVNASSSGCALLVVEDDAFTLFTTSSGNLDAISTLKHRRESELIDREMRRVVLVAGAGGRPAYLAMPAHLDAMAPASAAQALRSSDYLDGDRYADFRDLVFRSVVEGGT